MSQERVEPVRPARPRIYLLGDAHMGARQTEQEEVKYERMVTFLRSLHGAAEAQLVICGDLFDFWFEYCQVIPRHHFHLLTHLADLIESGVPIDYLAGNHDFWLGSFLQEVVGVTIHRDTLDLNQAGKHIHLRHGDGLKANDRLYRMMKAVLRHPWSVAAYRLLHPDVGIPFALFCSHLSRESARDEYQDDSDYRQWARRRIEAGDDLVVLGHTHVAALEAHQAGWYLNAGAWMTTFTYGRIEAGVPSLWQWDGTAGRPYQPLPAIREQ
jgi:UDP-2,3-diacylglucosamine hydrolase